MTRKGIPRSEAQIRADKKYRKKLRRWYTDLPAELFQVVEQKRNYENKTRRQILEEYVGIKREEK